MTLVTWDSINKGTSVNLSNENLTATISNVNSTALATVSKESGKWYWELKAQGYIKIGIVKTTVGSGNSYRSSNAMYYGTNGMKSSGYSEVPYGSSFGGNDIISVLLDLDEGIIEFWKNGVSQGNAYLDANRLEEIYAAATVRQNTSSTVTANFGSTPFTYEMPEGYFSYDGSQYSSYDRFLIQTSNNETITIKYDESKIENAIPVMTSNTSPEGEVIYSSYYDTYYPWKAFDKSTAQSDRWATSSSTGYLGYKFSIKKIITSYTITHATSLANTLTPNTWTFEASNDGTDWIVLDSQHSQIFQSKERRKYTFFNDKEYLLYRINVSKNNGHNYLSIGELEMSEYFPYTYRYIPMATEQNFINHGMDRSIQLDLSTQFKCKVYIEQIGTALGEGKVFKKMTDTSKKSIKSVKIN